MKIRKRLTAALTALGLVGGAVGVLLPFTPAAAAPPVPVILNADAPTSANASWLETQNLTDGGHNRVVQSTMLVKVAEGRTIDGVKVDANWNGTDDTAGAALTTSNVFVDLYDPEDGAMQTAIVTTRINVGNGPNFSGRAFNAPYRMRVVDSDGEQSASVTGIIRFVEEGQDTGTQDYPSLRSFTPGEASWVAPGGSVSFGPWRCDDPDTNFFSDDDVCDRANQRWRRLDDGDIITLGQRGGIGDNQDETVTTTAPTSNGHWVYEMQFCNEDGGCPTAGQGSGSNWWRIGKAVVNSASSSLSGTITFGGTAVEPSTPPSVNAGDVVTADASVADTGGLVQVIEWNMDHNSGANSSFEDAFYTVPTVSGGNIGHPNISSVAGSLSRTISTTTHGLKTVQARIRDNGALDAGDLNGTGLTFQSGLLRVNAKPLTNAVTTSTNEDTPVTITLNGSDPDNQPVALRYTVSGVTPSSAGTLGTVSGNQVTFTPAANFNGPVSFTYQAHDGVASTIPAWTSSVADTVSITVNAVNDAPVLASPKSIVTNEETAGSVLMTATDAEGQNVTYTVNTNPAVGSATCSASTDQCTYTPPLNFFGSTSFTVKGTDTQGGFGLATVNVTVNPVNDAPVANNQGPVNVPEDSAPVSITLTASDVDSSGLTFTAPLDDVDHGDLSCLSPPVCTYEPDANYNGPDSFTFRASDGIANSNVATVTINVSPSNDAPVATDVSDAVAQEDVATPIAATGTDVDLDPVTVTGATDPANGSANVTGANEVTYKGDLDFHGTDTYDFTVSDGNGGTDVGTVMVTVTPVNDAPTLPAQTFDVLEDTPALISIGAGDVDGDLLGWSVTVDAAEGSVVGTGPDVIYVPAPNWSGTDTFTVEVSDGTLTAETQMTVVVAAVNDRPVAVADAVTTTEDGTVTFDLEGTDPDGDPLTFLMGSVTPLDGAVSCDAPPTCTYAPNGNFNGADLFTFVVDDGTATDEASISITVTPVNDDPTAQAVTVETDEDEGIAIGLVAGDVDGDLLTFEYGAATSGDVTGGGPDAVYTPNPNFAGTDQFGFTVDDGHGGTNSAVVTIEVAPVNDAPVATGGTVATPEETEVAFSLGATDVEDDPLTFSVPSPPAEGDLTCDSAGACSYDPATDYSGPVAVDYEVSDGDLTSAGTLVVLVDPVNDPPAPTGPDAVTTDEDEPITFSLAADDAEGDELTYAVVSPPASGGLVCTADGSCTYTPSTNTNGTDGFTWSASDGTAATNGDTALVVVAVNDAPQVLDVAAETNEDHAVVIPLLATDAEGDAITFSVDALPGAGTVTISGSQATYLPNLDYSGTDGFTVEASDPSGASTIAQVSIVVNELPLLSTKLVAEAAVAKLQLTPGNTLAVWVFPNLRATLTTTAGVPVIGRTITFRVGNGVVCSAVTNHLGVGECYGNAAGIGALLNLGYQVSFAGDLDFSASSAKGPIIQLGNLRI